MDIYNLEYINTDGNYIHQTAIIADNVELGKGNIIMPYTVIGEAGFFKGEGKESKGKVVIGNNNKIGANVTIMAGEDGKTIIGNDCQIMSHVNIGHDCVIEDKCIIAASSCLAGFVTLKRYVNLGINVTVKNRINILEGCMIGAGAVITKDTKNWTEYQGVPAKQTGFNSRGADKYNIPDAYEKFINA